jgi:hypothetical protein
MDCGRTTKGVIETFRFPAPNRGNVSVWIVGDDKGGRKYCTGVVTLKWTLSFKFKDDCVLFCQFRNTKSENQILHHLKAGIRVIYFLSLSSILIVNVCWSNQ